MKTLIGITGVGMVGGAVKYGLEKNGYQVFHNDPRMNSTIDNLKKCGLIFICVPTPTMPDGSCDLSIVESSVKEAFEQTSAIIAIKSTVEPGTTQRLIEQYNNTDRICFVPEFLRERAAISDFTENHDLLAIGTESHYVFDLIKKVHGRYPQNVVQLTPTEAEIIKYYSNVLNAMRVVFANEMYEICQALGADYNSIKSAFIKRGTINDMYLDVNENFRGYAGPCLPKDTKALAALVRKLGLDLKLFECIDSENAKFKATVFEGMRP